MINEYKKRLNFFVNYLDDYILPESKEIIKNQISSLIKVDARRNTVGRWKFKILREFPVKFHPCDINGNKVQVDFSCNIDGEIPPLRHGRSLRIKRIENYTILIRLWSLEENLSCREEFDSEDIMHNIRDNNMERVILRFHLDKRKEGTDTEEPFYHIQFGGISQANEFNWYPKSINVPRFQFFPLDIILATEFILVNFFALESFNLREDPEWKRIIHTAQKFFLDPAILQYHSFIQDPTETFLAHSIKWNL